MPDLPDLSVLLSKEALAALAFVTFLVLTVTQIVKDLLPESWRDKAVRVMALVIGLAGSIAYVSWPKQAVIVLVGVLGAYIACFGAYPSLKALLSPILARLGGNGNKESKP